jgi:hypothetical protein
LSFFDSVSTSKPSIDQTSKWCDDVAGHFDYFAAVEHDKRSAVQMTSNEINFIHLQGILAKTAKVMLEGAKTKGAEAAICQEKITEASKWVELAVVQIVEDFLQDEKNDQSSLPAKTNALSLELTEEMTWGPDSHFLCWAFTAFEVIYWLDIRQRLLILV